MSRTLSDFIAFERYILNEKTETFWEDPELTLFSNFEYNNLVTEISALHAGFYEELVTLTATINSPLVPLPSNHGGEVLSLSFEQRPLQFKPGKERLHAYSAVAAPPIHWGLRGNNIILSSPASAAHALDLEQTYIPPDMALLTDVADFPRGYEMLIPLGTIIYGLMKDKQSLQDLDRKYNIIKQRMFTALQNRQIYRPRRVREI